MKLSTGLAAVLSLALVASMVIPDATPKTLEPIRLYPQNPHYFLFRGQPAFLITSGEHYGSVLHADFDFKKYLSTLAADGLNDTRLFGGSYIEVPVKSFGIQRNDLAPQLGRFIAPWLRSSSPGYAGGGGDSLDYSFSPGYEDGYDLEPNGPGGGSPALRRQLAISANFFCVLLWGT